MSGDLRDAVLDAVEREEAKSLRWGDVDGSLSRAELLDLASTIARGDDPEDTVEALVEARLLYEFDAFDGPRYRSRFGETVRLLARLRQIFPGRSWRAAPPLVADFRVDQRPRRFPKQNRRAAEFEGAASLDRIQQAVLDALVAPFNGGMIARFQEEALSRLMEPSRDQGTIVTAGTGSGKTLAFYLPAFLRFAGASHPDVASTKALALYPRNELLKDQASSAYRMAGLARIALTAAGRRPIRIGTYYGGTPKDVSEDAITKARWPRRASGWGCPFLRCPACEGEFVWTSRDVTASVERMSCISCGTQLDTDLVALTRSRVEQQPPDVLFTTTEMLNQRMSDTRRRAVFGIGLPRERRPDLILLDEAHTYGGPSGAQAALTLRRWRALLGSPVSWVGLSATLAEPRHFFADLAGLDLAAVEDISPAEGDMDSRGCEYQILLRGDPASRAALLSTSIQAAMLVARILDPAGGRSEGRYGRRLFAFTDDLDVVNRLHDDLQNAEGNNIFGEPDRNRGPLAVLRARTDEPGRAAAARDADGQRWLMPERIGHDLRDRLVIGRTTARDPGVDGRASVVVATSALEVGFNDPSVGAVLQHKGPRSLAAFLQRRGRAGRDRRMRPLTVTVLSDYGRDRHLFQSYELLFEPVLAPQALPIRNQFILRMQATYALLDWLAAQPRDRGVRNGWVWASASGPSGPNDDGSFRRHVTGVLGNLLKGEGSHLDGLRQHLKAALRLDAQAVERLLWEPPRSILLEVVPTLLRRMFRDFRLAWPDRAGGPEHERSVANHPLPEFVPRTLFADLNLPEVEIGLPAATVRDVATSEALPILQALTQFPPGRVNRRFGEAYGGLSHWVPIPMGVDAHVIEVGEYAVIHEFAGTFAGVGEDGDLELPVFRPWRIQAVRAAKSEIRPTSNARLRWCSGFVAQGDGTQVNLPAGTIWRRLVTDLRLHLHRFRSGVAVRRFAAGADASLLRPDGSRQSVDVTFSHQGAPAAVGFEFETDAISVDLRLPSGEELGSMVVEPALARALSTAFLRRLAARDPTIPPDVNPFERSWLRQAMVCAAGRLALERGWSLAEATRHIATSGDLSPLYEALDALLGTQAAVRGAQDDPVVADQDTAGDGPAPAAAAGGLDRLKTDLRERVRDAALRERLAAAVQDALCAGPNRGAFLRRCLESSLADAFLGGVAQLTPREATADALLSDVGSGPGGATRVWVTETTLGGAGVIQAVAETIAREPRALFRAVEATLEPSDLEMAGAALARTVRLSISDAAVAASLADLRAEQSHDGRARQRRRFLTLLESRGVEVGRTFAAALSIRLLAPGTGPATDRLVASLLDLWDRVEITLGLTLDLREVAVLATSDPLVEDLARAAGAFDSTMAVGEKVDIFAGLLWPRSDALRREAFAGWNPFRPVGEGDPAFLRALLFDDGPAVRVGELGWEATVAEALGNLGAVRLAASASSPESLRAAILRMLTTPIEVGYLRLYPVLERFARSGDDLFAVFVLRERV